MTVFRSKLSRGLFLNLSAICVIAGVVSACGKPGELLELSVNAKGRVTTTGSRSEPAPSIEAEGPQPEIPSDLVNENGEPIAAGTGPTAPVTAISKGAESTSSTLAFFPPGEGLAPRFESLKDTTMNFIDDALGRLATRMDRSAIELRKKRDSGRVLTQAQGKCVAAYDRLYAKEQVEIRIALGYDDYEGDDTIMDPATRAGLITYFSRPCENKTVFACGFELNEKSELIKTVQGPDSKPRTLVVRIQDASYSVSNELNRGEGANWQTLKSEIARSFFLEGMGTSDIVIYAGHSRDGGGPSFEPPRLVQNRDGYSCAKYKSAKRIEACTVAGREVDYDWYHANRLNEEAMLKALALVPHGKRPQMLVLASCYSNRHFGAKIRQTAPEMGFLGTRSLLGASAMTAMVTSTVDGLVRQSCRGDLIRPLLKPEFVDEEKHRLDGNPQLLGFF